MKEPATMTTCVETLPALVMFKFSSEDDQFRAHLFDAILSGKCPDFECSLGSPSGTGSSYTALWRTELAAAVRAWARTADIHVTCEATADIQGHIKLPNIGDIAPGGVVAPCIADVERMLADQGLEPTARNWIAVCDHFISQPLIRVEHAGAFRLLRQAIERAALSAVMVDVGASEARNERRAWAADAQRRITEAQRRIGEAQKETDQDPGPLSREELVALIVAKDPRPLTKEELSTLITAKSSAVELLVALANGSKNWVPAKITGWSPGGTAVHIEIKRLDGSPMYFSYGVAEARHIIRHAKKEQ
jgi:hypothetical protein